MGRHPAVWPSAILLLSGGVKTFFLRGVTTTLYLHIVMLFTIGIYGLVMLLRLLRAFISRRLIVSQRSDAQAHTLTDRSRMSIAAEFRSRPTLLPNLEWLLLVGIGFNIYDFVAIGLRFELPRLFSNFAVGALYASILDLLYFAYQAIGSRMTANSRDR